MNSIQPIQKLQAFNRFSGQAMPLPYGSIVQLGQSTRINPLTGNVLLNLPLIDQLVQQGPPILAPLAQLLQSSMQLPQIVEGLYLAQRLAEAKTPGVRILYASAARFNTATDPIIQAYLAGFYRKLNVPESFGPMLSMLIRNTQNPPRASFDPNEEVGGTLLSQLTASQKCGCSS